MDEAAQERKARLEAAHMTLQQARKYPDTVNLSAVSEACDYIRAVAIMDAQMSRSTTPQVPA